MEISEILSDIWQNQQYNLIHGNLSEMQRYIGNIRMIAPSGNEIRVHLSGDAWNYTNSIFHLQPDFWVSWLEIDNLFLVLWIRYSLLFIVVSRLHLMILKPVQRFTHIGGNVVELDDKGVFQPVDHAFWQQHHDYVGDQMPEMICGATMLTGNEMISIRRRIYENTLRTRNKLQPFQISN